MGNLYTLLFDSVVSLKKRNRAPGFCKRGSPTGWSGPPAASPASHLTCSPPSAQALPSSGSRGPSAVGGQKGYTTPSLAKVTNDQVKNEYAGSSVGSATPAGPREPPGHISFQEERLCSPGSRGCHQPELSCPRWAGGQGRGSRALSIRPSPVQRRGPRPGPVRAALRESSALREAAGPRAPRVLGEGETHSPRARGEAEQLRGL